MQVELGKEASSADSALSDEGSRLPEVTPSERLEICCQNIKELKSAESLKEKELTDLITETVKGIELRVSSEGIKIPDNEALLKLALAEVRGDYRAGSQHHHCNCGSDATWFLDKTSNDGFKELVKYESPKRNCPYYWIPDETFETARLELIARFGSVEEKEALSKLKIELYALSNNCAEINAEIERLTKEIKIGEIKAKYGLSPKATKHLMGAKVVEDISVCSPDVFAYLKSRSDYGTSGGIAKYSDLFVYHEGQVELRSFQWRDRYSASQDQPHLRIDGLKACRIADNGAGLIEVFVDVKNRSHGDRTVQFNFHAEPASDQSKEAIELSDLDREVFLLAANDAREKVETGKFEMYKLKPTMPGPTGRVPYLPPGIKDCRIMAEYGVGAIIAFEQLDHFLEDRQMRYELYLVTKDQLEPRCVYEDHAYIKREGNDGAFFIVTMDSKSVTINTRNGLREIPFGSM